MAASPMRHPQALAVVEELHDRLGFSYRELAGAIHADEATLHRWRKGSGAGPSPVYLARLAALQAFVDELGRTFREWTDAAAWVDRPAPAFRDETPRALVLAGHVDRVTGVLYALNAGVLA
jgi:transcriptional regulator with XRE-family HTH domain